MYLLLPEGHASHGERISGSAREIVLARPGADLALAVERPRIPWEVGFGDLDESGFAKPFRFVLHDKATKESKAWRCREVIFSSSQGRVVPGLAIFMADRDETLTWPLPEDHWFQALPEAEQSKARPSRRAVRIAAPSGFTPIGF